MEIKAELQKPFEEQQRTNFIVQQNHRNGYEIRETETALQAWGYTEEEIAQQEREALNMLSLTKREVFLAIYRDKQITPEQIRAMLTSEEAKIEFDYANDYFRGNPLIGQLGEALGYTSQELDSLFINKGKGK
ncbi:MAG: hypothetical protein MJ237_02615 [bacterium]|nr:hypothetical protein [bacterium]